MRTHTENMTNAVLLGLFAVVCIIPAWMKEDWPLWVRLTLAAAGCVMFFFAAALTINWIFQQADAHAYRLARYAAMTPETETLRLFAALQPWQVEAWLKNATALIAEPGLAGALLFYDIDGERIPTEFVQEFFESCTEEKLQPVRSYGEGTTGRAWATAITDWCVKRGLAVDATGNQPARWKLQKADALRRFNLIDNSLRLS